jgi:prepilin-type N-terminal cleavage/methylation domain-containing protein
VKATPTQRGFTLIELLVVISIMGIIAAISVPAIKSFGKANAMAAATRQLLDDVHRARQLAISQHSVVFMIFVPTNFWTQPAYGALAAQPAEKAKADRLFDKQLTSYTFVTMRGVGDQPGRSVPRYLSAWRSLPEGTFIAPWKFSPRNTITKVPDPANAVFNVPGFSTTNTVPFPSEFAPRLSALQPYLTLPYVAFDSTGRLLSGVDEFIPVASGAVQFARDVSKKALNQSPALSESPPGNSTNSFNLVHVDWLTGRARIESPQVQ